MRNRTRAETSVFLARSEVLRRVLHLPLAAVGNLREILRHELERQSPIDPSAVYFDHSIRERDQAANRLEVELRIVKRASIERAIGLCRFLGLEPVSVGINGDDFLFNRSELPLNRPAVMRALWRRWSAPALSALILLLGIAVLTGSLARNEIAAAELADRVADAQAKAAAVRDLRDEIASAEKRAEFVTSEKQRPMMVRILAELTRTLPDGTWIFSLQVNGGEVRIRGFSSSASALIALFDKSAIFANAQFRAPLTQGQQSGIERFDLSFQVKGLGA